MISRGEGMTSLHLKTNKEETILTFLLVSGFPQQHWQIYPRIWLWVISPVSVLYTWESCRKQDHTESMYVLDEPFCCLSLSILHSSTPGSTSPFTCVQLSPVFKLCQPDVNLLSKHQYTMQYRCLQLQLVHEAMQKTVQTLEWPHLSLLCFSIAPSWSSWQIPVLWRILQPVGLPQTSCKDKQGSSSCFSQPALSIPHQLIKAMLHNSDHLPQGQSVQLESQLQIPQMFSKWISTLYRLDSCVEMNCKWKNYVPYKCISNWEKKSSKSDKIKSHPCWCLAQYLGNKDLYIFFFFLSTCIPL